MRTRVLTEQIIRICFYAFCTLDGAAVIEYVKHLAEETGIPYQNLINRSEINNFIGSIEIQRINWLSIV